MDLSAIALQGLEQAQIQLEKTATRLASGEAPDGATSDTVDLSAEMVALLSAKNQFSANLSTLKIADEIEKNVIDLMA
ncbi:MAG: hypothetical protein HY233_02490 [Acidobacteriales bacterium]|nr:hypothetical protein [Candidatus Koribacter versatilis]MBI3644823.1 hypothetical protein [Terriglobales bacterium]